MNINLKMMKTILLLNFGSNFAKRLSLLPLVIIACLISLNISAQTALNFDGVDDQVTTTEDFMIEGWHSRTIEAWIKTSGLGDHVIAMWGIDEIGKKCVLRVDSGYLRYESGDGFSVATGTLLNDGEWHHVAAVLPEGGNQVDDIIMYVDGEIEPHPGHFRVIETVASPLIIGNSSIHNDRYFDGSIDELRIWNIGRSAEEIAFYMNYELCDETGLLARYSMEEGLAGEDNTDISEIIDNIDANNGTLENFNKEFDTSNWVEGINAETITGEDVQYFCVGESFTWIDGITYTEPNNTASFLLEGAAVNTCDSIALLNLTEVDIDPSVTTNDPSITANQGGASYQWLDCNNGNAEIDGATDQTFVPEENGTYAVEIISNGCAATSDCVEIISVGIEELSAFNETRLYPNPNQGMINIELGQLDEISVQVLDLNGKLIYEHGNIKSSTFQFELEAPAGTYIVEISSGGMNKQYKIVKQN